MLHRDSDWEPARWNSQIHTHVSARDESFANPAAGNVVFSRGFNVQVWKGGGDCLTELPNALAPLELPHRDKVTLALALEVAS